MRRNVSGRHRLEPVCWPSSPQPCPAPHRLRRGRRHAGPAGGPRPGHPGRPQGVRRRRPDGSGQRPTPTSPTCRTSTTPTTSRGTSRCTSRRTRRADSAKLAANRRAAFGARPGVNARGVLTPFVHDEEEPAGTAGSNDTARQRRADRRVRHRRRPGCPRVRILGELAAPAPAAPRTADHHRGPGLDPAGHRHRHRRRGRGQTERRCSATARTARAGRRHQRLRLLQPSTSRPVRRSTADTEGSAGRHRHDPRRLRRRRRAAGRRRRQRSRRLNSLLSYTPEAPGTYYVMVGRLLLRRPAARTTRSTPAAAPAAPTRATTASPSRRSRSTPTTTPCALRPGDVVGGARDGRGHRPDGRDPSGEQRVGGSAPTPPPSTRRTRRCPAAATRPSPTSPRRPAGTPSRSPAPAARYDVTVEGYRPGTQIDRGRAADGAPRLRAGPGQHRHLGRPRRAQRSRRSRRSSPQWGIARAEARGWRTGSSTRCGATCRTEIAGANPTVTVEVLNARDNAEPDRARRTSRGSTSRGTIAETGISTIGIAQYIDPGNFGHEDEAIVLLDVLSAPAGPASSLNTYMNADQRPDRVRHRGRGQRDGPRGRPHDRQLPHRQRRRRSTT